MDKSKQIKIDNGIEDVYLDGLTVREVYPDGTIGPDILAEMETSTEWQSQD